MKKFWYSTQTYDQDNVLVVNSEGNINAFSSLLKTSLYTGISDNHIRNVCNSTTLIYVYSSVLEEALCSEIPTSN